MKCPQCSNDMIKTKATAFGEEYDYCKQCKKELKELVTLPKLEEKPKDLHDDPYRDVEGFFYLTGQGSIKMEQHDWFNNTASCKKCGIRLSQLCKQGYSWTSETCPGKK